MEHTRQTDGLGLSVRDRGCWLSFLKFKNYAVLLFDDISTIICDCMHADLIAFEFMVAKQLLFIMNSVELISVQLPIRGSFNKFSMVENLI